MSFIPTPASRAAADTLLRKAFTAAGLPPAVHEEMCRQSPFRDPLSLEAALGRAIAAETGAMPNGRLLHAAAGDLIDARTYPVTYLPADA